MELEKWQARKRTRLDDWQVLQARHMFYNELKTIEEIMEFYGVSQYTARRLVNGQARPHLVLTDYIPYLTLAKVAVKRRMGFYLPSGFHGYSGLKYELDKGEGSWIYTQTEKTNWLEQDPEYSPREWSVHEWR